VSQFCSTSEMRINRGREDSSSLVSTRANPVAISISLSPSFL
jgi:hypothetical protein